MDPSPDLPPINDPAAAYIPQPPSSTIQPTYFPQPPPPTVSYISQPPYNISAPYMPQPPTTLPAVQVFPPATTEPPAFQAPNYGSNSILPPYAEMITAAIAALKEKDGSSRQAIAKYIESQYSNLPSTHSTLLTQTLKRLKNSGQLVMIKHSYALPSSAPIPLSIPPPPPPAPAPAPTTDNPTGTTPKRGPGRPPKVKPDLQPNGGLQPVSIAPVNFEPVSIESVTIEPVSIEPESMLVSLGLVDEGPKRARGRPPKANSEQVVAVSESGGPSVGKRGRGRPPRPKSLAVVKRGRGRPVRSVAVAAVGIENGRRPRGRPKRSAISGISSAGRPRGRPPKNVALHGGAGGVLPAKRPGRPPKAGGAKKARKLSGRPLGRPKKDASVTAIASVAHQETAYQDLKSKLEHFQSRIKHTLSVVKPYFNTEVTVSAVGGALRELEELASMDLSAPTNVQIQEPLPQN
ncbi:hypothetical protein LguiA_027867 [Lonicera macranthoides]